jgi:outer membrane receptor protein involved in Fe transport
MTTSGAEWTRHAAIRAVVRALAPLALALPAPAHAQSLCPSRLGPAASAAGSSWPAPLDRVVSFQARDVSLRDALGHLAAAAHVRLSYSSELLPLDRRVCVSHEAVSVGDALAELLHGTTLEPRAVAADHIALAPVLAAGGSVVPIDTATAMARTTTVLDRVVVTGSTVGGAQRSLPVAVDVISGPQLERRVADGTLSRILGGATPGIWIWEQSPSSLLARYGSIRGASSFGASYPKVYIDGIEVANPLLITQVSPEMIERIEVIRGPQGAALYGTDAISGVINVITRNGGVADGGQHVRLQSDAGVAHSDFASGASLAQRHALTLRAGSGLRSAGLGITVGTVGAFLPNAYSRTVTATGSARLVTSRSVVTGTGRFVAQRASPSVSPLITDSVPESTTTTPGPPGMPPRPAGPQSAQQYTVGASARFTPSGRWTHAAVVGIDGYRLTDVPDDVRSIPIAADASLRSVRGAADRGTVRLSSVASFGSSDHASAALTLAAEHSVLHEESDARDSFVKPAGGGGGGPGEPPSPPYATSWRSNTGLIAQTNVAWREALYLTGGVRVERNDGFAAIDQVSTLPMLGASLVRDRGDVTLKLRAAYGKGIRPQRMASRETTWAGIRGQATSASLAPEQQAGVEAGVELLVGRAFTLQATRFDQLASGLIQRVAIGADADPASGPGPRHVMYALQNVGEITNRGWELESSATHGRFSLTGTLSLVDSRVRRTATGYTGDLRAGDRMLEVPARTAGLTASWTGARWFGALTASRAADWVNYDRLALAWAVVNDQRPTPPDEMGTWLRSFWRTYDGVTRLRLTTSRDLRRGFALVLTGDNLLDQQLGEPDNVTILPGRTITAGIRAAF